MEGLQYRLLYCLHAGNMMAGTGHQVTRSLRVAPLKLVPGGLRLLEERPDLTHQLIEPRRERVPLFFHAPPSHPV